MSLQYFVSTIYYLQFERIIKAFLRLNTLKAHNGCINVKRVRSIVN